MTTVSSSLPVCPKFQDPTHSWARPEIAATTKFVAHMATVLNFLRDKGIEMICRDEPLSYQEWNILLDWTFQAWYYGVGGDYSRCLFERLVEKGVNDLGYLISISDDAQKLYDDWRKRGVVGSWLGAIEYNLDHARIKNQETRSRLIILARDAVLIPLCKKFDSLEGSKLGQRREFFRTLAVNRFPGDSSAQELFMDDCVRLAEKS